MPKLTLSLKAEYFHAIRAGSKPKEYRLVTPYWRKRLEDRTYDGIVLTLGYPSRDDASRRLERPWRGFARETITHPHFGPEPVEVYAIHVAAYDDSEEGGDEILHAALHAHQNGDEE